jgi:hypothetical protein
MSSSKLSIKNENVYENAVSFAIQNVKRSEGLTGGQVSNNAYETMLSFFMVAAIAVTFVILNQVLTSVPTETWQEGLFVPARLARELAGLDNVFVSDIFQARLEESWAGIVAYMIGLVSAAISSFKGNAMTIVPTMNVGPHENQLWLPKLVEFVLQNTPGIQYQPLTLESRLRTREMSVRDLATTETAIMPIFAFLMVNITLVNLVFKPLISKVSKYLSGETAEFNVTQTDTNNILRNLGRFQYADFVRELANADSSIANIVMETERPSLLVDVVPGFPMEEFQEERFTRRRTVPTFLETFQHRVKQINVNNELLQKWIPLKNVKADKKVEIPEAANVAQGRSKRSLEIEEELANMKVPTKTPAILELFAKQQSPKTTRKTRTTVKSPLRFEPPKQRIVLPQIETFIKDDIARCELPELPSTGKTFRVSEILMDPVGNQYLKGLTTETKEEVLYPVSFCTKLAREIQTSPRISPGGTIKPGKTQGLGAIGLTDEQQIEQVRKQYGDKEAKIFAIKLRSRERRGFRG